MKWILIMFTAYIPNVDSKLQEIEMRDEESCRELVHQMELEDEKDASFIFQGSCEEK